MEALQQAVLLKEIDLLLWQHKPKLCTKQLPMQNKDRVNTIKRLDLCFDIV
jgi:hypothetical protein